MIDPTSVSTIRVGELSPEPFSLTDNIPHEVGTELKRGTIEDLATFISAFIGSTDGVGFRAISVTDGQTLPTTTQQEFILVGKGIYYNVVGGSTIICTEELNAIVSNGSYWFIGVEIPVNVELAGITQFIRDGFISTTPSEDAVYDALALKANVADSEDVTNKVSVITGYDVDLYPNEKATHDALDLKLNISDLPTNLTLYPTNVASDVSGYVKMVTNIHDADYNVIAVDISTPTITTTNQLVASLITNDGVLIGQPGVFNATTFGNIRRLSGSGTATFYFEVYHRDAAGVETLICTSSISNAVVNGTYQEFTASGVWDDGEFSATDRIVIKSYANRIVGGSDPVYQFQFGGSTPVRTLLPVPFSVVDAGYELKANKQNDLTIDGTGTKYPTVDAVNVGLLSKKNILLITAFDNVESGLIIYSTVDGKVMNRLKKNSVYTPSSGVLRDPSIIKVADTYYVVHSNTPSHTDFNTSKYSIIKSKNLIDWTFVTDIELSSYITTSTAWAPEWFVDTNGDVFVIISINNNIYAIKHYGTDFLNINAPVNIGLPSNTYIDGQIIREGSKYIIFVKNEITKYIERFESFSLLSGWGITGSGDWAGWGSGLEGCFALKLNDGTVRIYFDAYVTSKYYFSTAQSAVSNTWSNKQELSTYSGYIRHFSALNLTDFESITLVNSIKDELNPAIVTGTGSVNTFSKFTSSNTLASGVVKEFSNTAIGIGDGVTVLYPSEQRFIVRQGLNKNLVVAQQGGEISLESINDAVTANIPIRFLSSKFSFLNGNLLLKTTIDNDTDAIQTPGSILTSGMTISTVPTTSANGADILTRNWTTGKVEKILSSTIAKIDSPTFTGIPSAPTATAGTNTTQLATTAFVQGIRPYKVYTAILTQTGTNAPTAIVLENTLGGAVVWTRTSSGSYVGTLAGAFVTNKTVILYNASSSSFSSFVKLNTSNNTIDWQNGSDDRMLNNGTMIEIRVYN